MRHSDCARSAGLVSAFLLLTGFSPFGSHIADAADLIPEPIPTGTITAQLDEVATGFVLPLHGASSPIDPTHLFVIDQTGIVHDLDLSTGQQRVFLDVSDRLVTLSAGGGERGLLGFAFHPQYQSNGLVYTYTSEPAAGAPDFTTLGGGETPNHQSVILEWTVNTPTSSTAVVDPGSARELLRIDQPQANHNGGALAFDADGNLYIALGDGGGSDDQGTSHGVNGNGRDPETILGSVLRIDPLGSNSANGAYGIPADNPFVGIAGLDEIFAYGLRNPFRINVDSTTGETWVPDVGQNDIEEINILTAGANYGWNWKEGSFFFDANGTGPGFATATDPGGVPADLVDPVAEYDHDEGIAVIGGGVYRGNDIAGLGGMFVFGDFAGTGSGGRIFYLQNDMIREFDMAPLAEFVTGFGQDGDGELYVMTNASGGPAGTSGTVYRLAPGGSSDGCNNIYGCGGSGGGGGGGGGYGSGAIGLLTLMALGFGGLLFRMRQRRE